MGPFIETHHPNRLKRDREEYGQRMRGDSRFQKELQYFDAVPSLVRPQPHVNIPSLSQVEWSDETSQLIPDLKDSTYFIIGGVCWPMPVDEEGLVGMGVLLAVDLRTLVVWVLSERKFITVERTDDYPMDAPTPLFPWLRSAERFYRTRRFFQCQPESVVQKFRPSIIRAFPKSPRPSFADFRWNDFHTAMQTMLEYVALDRFRFFPSRLWSEMQQYDAIPDGTYPALHAACVALSGLDRLLTSEYNLKELLRKIDNSG